MTSKEITRLKVPILEVMIRKVVIGKAHSSL